MKIITYGPGHAVAQFVGALLTSRQVAGSIPDVVILFFLLPYSYRLGVGSVSNRNDY
jgi:sorbitol-specific phosphotransferase system component IIBC